MTFLAINIALVVFGLVTLTGKPAILSPYIAIGFYYYIFIYLPGYFLAKVFLKNKEYDLLEIIPYSLCAGYVFIFPWTTLAYVTKLGVGSFCAIYLSVVLVWIVFYALYIKKRRAVYSTAMRMESWTALLLGAIILAGVLMADYFGGFTSGNFLVHVSAIRKIAAFGFFEQHSCYFKDFQHNLNLYNSYYGLMGAISWITKIDPVKIWIYLPQFIVPIGLLAQFIFARKLFGSNRLAVLSLLFYFVYYYVYNPNAPAGGQAWLLSELAACNNYISIGIFLPVILTLALDYVSGGNRRLLFFFPPLFLADGTIHLYIQSKTYFLLFAFLFWALLARPQFINIRRLSAVALASCAGLVLFAYGFLVLTPNINPAYLTVNGTGGSWPVAYYGKWPVVALNTLIADPMVTAAVVSFAFVVFSARSGRAALFIFSSILSIAFVIYNPIIMKLGGIVHPAYERITRLYNIIPFTLAITFPFSLVAAYKSRNAVASSLLKILLAANLVVIAVLFVKAPQRLKQIVFTKNYSNSQLENNTPFYDSIRAAIPAGSTVMINLPLSTWWTTYFPHYIVAHAFDFVLPPNINQTPRKEDVRSFYSHPADDNSRALLARYKTDYLVLTATEAQIVQPQNAGYLHPISISGMVHIYKVSANEVFTSFDKID